MSKPKVLRLDNMSLHSMLNEDSELIPLMTPEDEEIINKESVPEILPILPLRNTVLFFYGSTANYRYCFALLSVDKFSLRGRFSCMG